MGARSVEVFQTIEDFRGIFAELQRLTDQQVRIFQAGPGPDCPLELKDELSTRNLLLTRADFASDLICRGISEKRKYVCTFQSPVILVELSRITSKAVERGRFWFHTDRTAESDGKRYQETKDHEFVSWAQKVLNLVKRRSERRETYPRYKHYFLPYAALLIDSTSGHFDTQSAFVFDSHPTAQ